MKNAIKCIIFLMSIFVGCFGLHIVIKVMANIQTIDTGILIIGGALGLSMMCVSYAAQLKLDPST